MSPIEYPDLIEYPSQDELDALKSIESEVYKLTFGKEDIPFSTLLKTGRAAFFQFYNKDESKAQAFIFSMENQPVHTISFRFFLKKDPSQSEAVTIFRRIYANWFLGKSAISDEELTSLLHIMIIGKRRLFLSMPSFLYPQFQDDMKKLKEKNGQYILNDLTPKEQLYRCEKCGKPTRNLLRYNLKCELCQGDVVVTP